MEGKEKVGYFGGSMGPAALAPLEMVERWRQAAAEVPLAFARELIREEEKEEEEEEEAR